MTKTCRGSNAIKDTGGWSQYKNPLSTFRTSTLRSGKRKVLFSKWLDATRLDKS